MEIVPLDSAEEVGALGADVVETAVRSRPGAVLGLATRRDETSSVVSNLLQLVSEAGDGRAGALDSPTH